LAVELPIGLPCSNSRSSYSLAWVRSKVRHIISITK